MLTFALSKEYPLMPFQIKRYRHILFAAGCALAFSMQTASAHTLTVGTCTNANPSNSTIQSAVTAASAGDTVAVCPGTYPEQIAITRKLTLEGINPQHVAGVPGQAWVTVPAGGAVANTHLLPPYGTFPVAAQILVAPASPATVVPGNVTIKNLVVDGTGNNQATCGQEFIGIYYQNAAGTISGNTVQNQLLPPNYQGCQDGEGIFVENAALGTGAVNITSNTVLNFDKNGITTSYAAAHGTISKNTITGIGPTTVIAQNGIQVGYGATASILTNTISNLIYSPDTYGSSGILLYDTQAGTQALPAVQHNEISSAQYAIALVAVNGTASGLVDITNNIIQSAQFAGVGLYSNGAGMGDDYIYVTQNTIENTSPYDGIDACSDNNSITRNLVVNSVTESAIHLDNGCTEQDGSSLSGVGNTVSNNRIEVACVGILSGPASGLNTVPTAGLLKNLFTDVTNTVVYGQNSYACAPSPKSKVAKTAPSAQPRGAPQPR
jgi:hypothetical protein